MWLYLETGSSKGGSGKMRSPGWGPDPTGLGSLQEEEVRTQTHSATTLGGLGEEPAVYTPRSGASGGPAPPTPGSGVPASRPGDKERLWCLLQQPELTNTPTRAGFPETDVSAPSVLGAGTSPWPHPGNAGDEVSLPGWTPSTGAPSPAGATSQLVPVAQGVPQLPEDWGTSVTNGAPHPGPRRPAAFHQQSASTWK